MNEGQQLRDAARDARLEDLRRILAHAEDAASVDAVDEAGRTALMLAASEGHATIVLELVRRGASVNAAAIASGRTPLLLAIEGGHVNTARLLLCNGAAIDASTAQSNVNGLMIAAYSGYLDIVEMLIDHGASLDARTKKRKTALMFAVEGGHMEIVELLISRGADLNATTATGQNAIMFARENKHDDIVMLLVDHCFSIANINEGCSLIVDDDERLRVGAKNVPTIHGRYGRTERHIADPSLRPEWFITRKEIETANDFFAGSFARVFHGSWDGIPVVVKSIIMDDESSREAFLSELEIWRKLQHPNIVRFFGACDDQNPFFVCEYALNGTLSHYLYREKSISHMWKLLHQTALGLKYLHKKHSVVHGDMKCSNILVGEDKAAKLADFGLSFVLNPAKVDTDITDEVGAIKWKAPEILQGTTRGTFASDVYSFGMCIIEAVKGEAPWGFMPDVTVKKVVLVRKRLPMRPERMSDKQWDLVTRMCAWEPSSRPDMTAVVDQLAVIADDEFNKAEELEWQRHFDQSKREIITSLPAERPEWFIDETLVKITSEPFAKGSFGSIHQGKYAGGGVVVKCLLEDAMPSKRAMLSFMKEAAIWRKLDHPHVIRLYGACDTSKPPFFVCESAVKYGNLDDYLCVHDKEKKTIWRLFYQTALGLAFLHQKQIVHGDLKCNNILVGNERKAKLADFGLSFIRSESKTMSKQDQTGAIQWVAPECLTGKVENPTYASDVYSLAMCIVQAFKGHNPWKDLSDLTVINAVKEGRVPFRPSGDGDGSSAISDEAWELVVKMCENDPSKRIPLAKVIKELEVFAFQEQENEDNEPQLCRNLDCCERNPRENKHCGRCGQALVADELGELP